MKLLKTCALLTICSATYAQTRTVDISSTFIAPAENAALYKGTVDTLKFEVENLGPDNMLTGDSLQVSFVGSEGALGYLFVNGTFQPGQKLIASVTLEIPEEGNIDVISICTAITPLFKDQIIDPDTSNNSDCRLFNIKEKTQTNISFNNSNNMFAPQLMVAPNPAKSFATLSYKDAKIGTASITIQDISGKIIQSQKIDIQHLGDFDLTLDV